MKKFYIIDEHGVITHDKDWLVVDDSFDEKEFIELTEEEIKRIIDWFYIISMTTDADLDEEDFILQKKLERLL